MFNHKSHMSAKEIDKMLLKCKCGGVGHYRGEPKCQDDNNSLEYMYEINCNSCESTTGLHDDIDSAGCVWHDLYSITPVMPICPYCDSVMCRVRDYTTIYGDEWSDSWSCKCIAFVGSDLD